MYNNFFLFFLNYQIRSHFKIWEGVETQLMYVWVYVCGIPFMCVCRCVCVYVCVYILLLYARMIKALALIYNSRTGLREDN